MSKSKQKSYGDAKVICPYYDSQETVQINCAPAVYDRSGLRVVFRSKVKKDEHMRSFCASYCWKGCPLAQLHDDAYQWYHRGGDESHPLFVMLNHSEVIKWTGIG